MLFSRACKIKNEMKFSTPIADDYVFVHMGVNFTKVYQGFFGWWTHISGALTKCDN